MNYDSILLASFGGPEGPADVMPFLERVTAGRNIPKERLAEVGNHYMTLGGVSPINELNRELLASLQEEMGNRNLNLPIFLGNRNSNPFFADALREIHLAGHRHVLAIATSAYSSYSGCRQYRENLSQALVETGFADSMTIDKVRNYFDHPGFIQPFADGLVSAVCALKLEGILAKDIHIFFTTHSIPTSMAETSGPPNRRNEFVSGVYVAQHNAALSSVLRIAQRELNISPFRWSLVYQSRSGAPQTPWLEPDISDAIKNVDEVGVKAVITIPIGFVSDHVEVIWDLDRVAKAVAEELGLRFWRVATPGKSLEFVSGLVDLIEERINATDRKALSELGPWPDFCPVGCCPNPRSELPTIAEAI